MIDTPKGTVGAVSTHFENRTDGAGRTAQMKYLFRKMSAYFPPDMPVIVGGDFNTNGFDGRDPLAKQAAWENQRAGGFLGELVKQEELFKIAKKHGYRWKETSKMAWSTRRVHLADDGTKAKDKHHSNILELHLDWLFARGLTPQDCGILETTLEAIRSDCGHPLLQKSKLSKYPITTLSGPATTSEVMDLFLTENVADKFLAGTKIYKCGSRWREGRRFVRKK